MKCSFCGTENELGSNFCQSCGKPLEPKDSMEKDFSNPNNFIDKKDFNNEDNETKRKKPLIIVAAAFVCIILLVIIGVMLFNPSPKKVFTSFTKALYNSTNVLSKEDYNTVSMKFKLNPSMTDTGSKEIESLINKMDFGLSGNIDYKNKAFLYNFNINYENKNLLNIDMQYDKNFYLILNDLYDKAIMVEESDFSEIFEKTDNEDTNIIIKSFVNAFNQSLKNDYLTSENKEIMLNNKKTKIKVTTLNLNSDNSKEMFTNIINYLLKDKEFLESYAKVSNKSKEDVKKELGFALNDIDNVKDVFDNAKISLYTKGLSNELVKVEIKFNDVEFQIEKGKTDNDCIIKVSSNNISLLLELTLTSNYNEKVMLKDVSNAIKSDEVSEDISTILENITKQDAYKALNDDIKSITGSSIDDLLSSLTNFNNPGYNLDNY